MYDLIIIGGGPAAISAAVYAARKKIKTLLLVKDFGGQIQESQLVDNYMGIPEISGLDLSKKFVEHLKKFAKDKSEGIFDLEIKEGEEVKSINQKTENFGAQTQKGIYEAKALIIATGKTERKLEIAGAKEFEGKGISYCATCDAPLFRDKIVAVIGAGDAGQDAAWQLIDFAQKVYIFNRYNELRGDNKELQEELKQHPKIEILYEVEPISILGDKFVNGLLYRNFRTKEEEKIDVGGIFVEIGSTPTSAFTGGLLRLNDKSEITVDRLTCATSVKGIFAAGDVTDILEKQVIIAAGMGAQAALCAYNYLRNK